MARTLSALRAWVRHLENCSKCRNAVNVPGNQAVQHDRVAANCCTVGRPLYETRMGIK